MKRKTGFEFIKRGIGELRSARGKWRFMNAAVSTTLLSFLAIEGVLALALAGAIFDYGVDRVVAEMHMISAADALRGLWRLFSNNMAMVAAVSMLIGVIFGLKSASETPASAG